MGNSLSPFINRQRSFDKIGFLDKVRHLDPSESKRNKRDIQKQVVIEYWFRDCYFNNKKCSVDIIKIMISYAKDFGRFKPELLDNKDLLKIENGGKQLTRILNNGPNKFKNNEWLTAFGTFITNKKEENKYIYIWKLKIIKQGLMCIGIHEDNNNNKCKFHQQYWWNKGNNTGYAYYTGGKIHPNGKKYVYQTKVGDIVEIWLNLKENNVIFKINGHEYKEKVKGDIQYRLAVAMYNRGKHLTSIEIIETSVINNL